MPYPTDLLIIGAGPFGLSLAAYARQKDIDYQIAGKSMGFWKNHMPAGMYLRSASDWHLDPFDRDTLLRYIEVQGKTPAEVEPLSLEFYLGYCAWFQEQQQIRPLEVHVVKLEKKEGLFEAQLADGSTLKARKVAIALGFAYFKYAPEELIARIPAGRYGHSCDEVRLERLRGQRCLIIGGRQSAFEWAALLQEAGAREVHVVHRHATPAFVEADWDWIPPLVAQLEQDPDGYRNLSEAEKKAISTRLWSEGRLKLEPWLKDRVAQPGIHLWPHTELASCQEQADGSLAATLSNGASLSIDHVLLSTGYKVDVSRIPFLQTSPLLEQIATRNGYPVLDRHMQTTVPGLYMSSMAAVQDFGPFFGFTVAVRTAARVLGAGL